MQIYTFEKKIQKIIELLIGQRIVTSGFADAQDMRGLCLLCYLCD